MRIIQLIDSLEAGGAERMALQYATVLAEKVAFSGLVATRQEGELKNEIPDNVAYLFLNKRKTLDWRAVARLRKYVLKNDIAFIHAHSSSYFLAVLVKLTLPKLKIIWHDHYGNSAFLANRPSRILRFCAPFFWGIIAVNQGLKDWSQKKLHFKNTVFLPNFPLLKTKENTVKTILKGESGKRIVCLANLRPQKNHLLLLKIAQQLQDSDPAWTFHLVGKDFQDDYSKTIKQEIQQRDLQQQVFLYDSCSDVSAVLKQAQIGVLTSSSEGLPVALLEYASVGLPVVVTLVGQVPEIVKQNGNGFVVASGDDAAFVQSLQKLIHDVRLREKFSANLQQRVQEQYSAQTVIKKYLHWVESLS
ncbi:glycosyltransferase family 4 protein [Flavobacterium agrisoli]|uniref:Glycosyltransferase family 4 protein n=1 Tax=Flavobacterium agrisoli TaxID=2793066 RepID=A0A934PPM2_9FLAO|nr:glycosyltransferase family 4 protein [Flavobacterium agrisoli]MBK0370730.1 glycosyltransferase family 4 protein [Flavobacterium agrisoli]